MSAVNFGATDAAFMELLRLAKGDLRLIERAFSEAQQETNQKPTWGAVKAKLRELAEADLEAA